MSRRHLIIASVVAHAGLGAGLFISGIWKLERLDHHHRASLTIGAMIPLGDVGGGERDAPEKKAEEKKKKTKKTEDKREKKKVELRQVEKIETTEKKEDPAEAETETGDGDGDGDGTGDGVGPGGGGGGGTCDPLVDPHRCQGAPTKHVQSCGNGIVESPEQCDDGNTASGDRCSATCTIEQIVIPPGIFTGMRIAGETQIVPPDPVKTQMLREGNERTVGSFKLCIDTGGRVSSIAPVGGGTKYPAYDAKIVTAMRGWRYKPYTMSVQGAVHAMPACSVVTFVYTIK